MGVFGAIGIVVGLSFFVYSTQPLPTPRANNLVFSDVTLVKGNASFAVRNVSGGPYPRTGFQITLIVNDFSNPPIPPGPNNSAVRITIGPNSYRIVWTGPER